MAFYIESRFVDIRTLVDFSEFNESDFYETPILNTSTQNDTNVSLPIQAQEILDNSQALEQVTKIIIESESQPDKPQTILQSQNEITIPVSTNEIPPPIVTNEITKPISSEETVSVINQIDETTPASQANLPAPKIEIVDKTSLFAKYINQRYEKEAATEFIKLLLNPFIVVLAYRYEFIDSFDSNSFSVNLRHLKNLVDKKPTEIVDNSEVSNEIRFQADLLAYNRKKDLERKLSRKF